MPTSSKRKILVRWFVRIVKLRGKVQSFQVNLEKTSGPRFSPWSLDRSFWFYTFKLYSVLNHKHGFYKGNEDIYPVIWSKFADSTLYSVTWYLKLVSPAVYLRKIISNFIVSLLAWWSHWALVTLNTIIHPSIWSLWFYLNHVQCSVGFRK